MNNKCIFDSLVYKANYLFLESIIDWLLSYKMDFIKGVSEAPLNIRGDRVENHFQAGIKIIKPDKLGSCVWL